MTKRPEEIALLAESGKLLADVFGYLDQLSLISMSTIWSIASSSMNSRHARQAKGKTGMPTRSTLLATTWFAMVFRPLPRYCKAET